MNTSKKKSKKQSKKQSKNKKERKLNWIQNFLCTCAGVDKEVLKQCPSEWNKYTCIGGTILSTGVLASISGGYALYTVFRDGNLEKIDTGALLPAIIFGIIWGLIIFNLDRFIVSTFRKVKTDIWWKRIGKELLQASPRILLALIIAIVISKPIEIKIFESRLAEQIQQIEIETHLLNKNKIEDIYGINNRTQDITTIKTNDSTLNVELGIDPPIVIGLINNELATAKSDLTNIQRINNPIIENHNRSIRNIRNNQNNYRPIRNVEGNIEYDNNGNIKQSLTQEANINIRSHNNEINRLRNEINIKQREVNRINELIDAERKNYKTQKLIEIADNKQALKIAEENLDSAKAEVEIETAEANKTTKKAFANNFITQIEALGKLTGKDTTMWWTSLMITLLFLMIELAPILTKLITNRGPYDEILERIEYENQLEQKELISQKNSEINELLKRAEEAAKLAGDTFIKAQKDYLDEELSKNNEVHSTIAKRQKELALMAIEKWHEAEKAKIEQQDPSQYIKSNTTS